MVHSEGNSEAELDAETPLRAACCGRYLDGARLEWAELEREEAGASKQSTGKAAFVWALQNEESTYIT